MRRKEKLRQERMQDRKRVVGVRDILNRLRSGGSSQEILEQIQADQEKGLKNELLAQSILQKLPYILSIERTGQYSDLDMYHYTDLVVRLRERAIKSVRVQVKSSFKSVKNMQEKIMRKHMLSDVDEYILWLQANKLIVLVANDYTTEKRLQNIFEDSLAGIEKYHTADPD